MGDRVDGGYRRVLLKLGDIYSGKTRRDMERTLGRLDALEGQSHL